MKTIIERAILEVDYLADILYEREENDAEKRVRKVSKDLEFLKDTLSVLLTVVTDKKDEG